MTRGGRNAGAGDRPSRLGQDEDWPELTWEEILAACADGVCPFCGKDSLQLIGAHLRFGHGVSPDDVREHYGLDRTQSFSSRELSQHMSDMRRRAFQEDPALRAMLGEARKKSHGAPGARRQQTVERLRRRGPEFGAALVRYRREHPEEMAAHQAKSIKAAAARYRELSRDDEWLDAVKRRFPLSVRREMARRWQAGETAAELARAYRAEKRFISHILEEQGVTGSRGRRQRYRHYILTPEQEKEIVRRRLAGESARELALEFGCRHETVDRLARWGRGELTDRERQVLKLLAETGSSREASARSGLSPHAMEYTLRELRRKLDVPLRGDILKKARELGLDDLL